MASGGDPVEELLAGLGAAARLFGELEDALREAAPALVEMDTAGAFRFLKETGPLLAGAGFGVLLPDWVRKARLGLKLTTRSRSTAGSSAGAGVARFGLGDLVDFRYDVAVGDEPLDPAELAELARLKVPLVRLRGQWVELDDAHLKAALKFLERNQAGTMTAADALTAGLGLGLRRGRTRRSRWSGWTPTAGWATCCPVRPTGGCGRWPRPLASPVSCGRTRSEGSPGCPSWASSGSAASSPTTWAWARRSSCCRWSPASAGGRPTLLVCPMSLVGNWQREAARFTPDLRVHVHHGADRLDGESLAEALAGADLVITTYGVATRDQAALGQVSWARVVCDEAQNIKNHATKQARAVRGLPAAARIALTGTPVENRLSELWSIMEFTNPGLLGPAERFRERYAVPIERHGSPEAAQSLKRLTQPFLLRRLKTDKTIISDLPDKQEMKVFCNLTPEQASLYQATVTDMLSRIEEAEDDISRRGLVLATMAKLKQVCNHPAHLLGDGSRLPGRSGKLARLEEICDEIVAEGDKALCFTQYAEFGRMLQPHLAARLGCPVLFLHGGTTKKQRDAMVEAFGELDEPALFLLSLKAGGTGLNLTAASHVIHVDRWWNPAVEDQATDRAFRIGQRRNVQVRKFVCVGTLEERIDAMIEEKKALAEQIVGTGEGWLTELSTDDLRSVLTLSDRRGERVMSGHWEDWPPAKPIRVDGGIKARSKRGAIGEQWWSRRFISVLESYGMSGRLARGRSYARAGQVLDFELAQGKVTARVQGSRVRPYQVRIGVLPLTTAQWRRVQDRLASQALFRAKLLAGEMPHEIEEVFAECGTPLFPQVGRRPGHALQLPGLGGAVQAPGRGLLRAGRGVRP